MTEFTEIGKPSKIRNRSRMRMAVRVLTWMVAGLFALQALVVAVLSVVATQRKQRKAPANFPHDLYGEITTGDGDRLKVYTYGQDLYNAMLAAIEYARESIYLETFIWKGDAVGEEFKKRLIRKAREGVKVYVIFDSFGNLVVPHEFKQFPKEVNVQIFRSIRSLVHLFDVRRYAVDHRKMLVIDGHIAFIGGYNLGSLYATEWRDTHLRIRGQAAADLAQSFVDFWNRYAPSEQRISRHYARKFQPHISLWSNDALRLTFPIRDMYIEAVDRAEHHIYLTNAYFVPDHVLLETLKAAAGRGVDVQVLLPWTSNHILADWASRGYFNECLEAGIRIFGYRNAMIHAKTCTIDGQWSTIGTANIDRLSSVGNFEINIAVYNEKLAHQMEDIFEHDKTNATEITLAAWSNRPWYVKLSERILAPLQIML